jgi:pyruvate/2-oxoglutarate dehydrogenase complex dihydrolipoamide dehydrogenase (E3) component
MTVDLFPADIYNQKTIQQGHPPGWTTHAAIATARLCVANALDGANRRARELVVPHCTYTDPEVAQVGLTPYQAREEGIPIHEYRLKLARVERAFIDGEEEGFAAIYTRVAVARSSELRSSPRMPVK